MLNFWKCKWYKHFLEVTETPWTWIFSSTWEIDPEFEFIEALVKFCDKAATLLIFCLFLFLLTAFCVRCFLTIRRCKNKKLSYYCYSEDLSFTFRTNSPMNLKLWKLTKPKKIVYSAKWTPILRHLRQLQLWTNLHKWYPLILRALIQWVFNPFTWILPYNHNRFLLRNHSSTHHNKIQFKILVHNYSNSSNLFFHNSRDIHR